MLTHPAPKYCFPEGTQPEYQHEIKKADKPRPARRRRHRDRTARVRHEKTQRCTEENDGKNSEKPTDKAEHRIAYFNPGRYFI